MYYNWRRVRYESAGLNNLKSELSISGNCYTSVNVDLSMSLNCSTYVCTQYWQAWVVVRKDRFVLLVRFQPHVLTYKLCIVLRQQ
nr:MAG TPA: hypothetical protein [Caudoviricetes sp.]